MTEASPVFSVIMATWGRGRHILPSIQSVLGQDFRDLELIVVGDACTDETQAVVAGIADPRLRWINLDSRCGSQSGPNNAGIAAARGAFIAYLGHDDIWETDHLARLRALYQSAAPPDFAVSGAIFHLPNGIAGDQVTGIFAEGADISRQFFPPSSFSHHRAVIDRIGPWRMPLELRAPVDEELLLRATGAGLRFLSTGQVTVHKFAAGHRYLSYVEPESDEQAAMLARLALPGHAAEVAAILAAARAGGTFMTGWDRNFARFEPGALARNSRQVKGLTAAPPVALGRGLTLQHPEENALFDWEPIPVDGYRKTRLNPRPRLLLPVLGLRARLSFAVQQTDPLQPLVLACNGEVVTARPGWTTRLRRFLRLPGRAMTVHRAVIRLRAAGPSVLEIRLSGAQLPSPAGAGIAIGPLRLDPLAGKARGKAISDT